jgi:glutamate synthase domain-containing protein 3
MVQIDASELDVRAINTRLRTAAERLCENGAQDEEQIVLTNPGARHNLGVGVVHPVKLTIQGSAGYFCMGLCDSPTVHVTGNVGWGFADNLLSGAMEVDGNAGAVCGVAIRDGRILVHGNVGSRAGQVMKGGSIVCRGDAGYRAGSMMMGGVLIVLGSAAEALGEFMMDGEIYVAGAIASLGQDAVQTDLRDGDAENIADILEQHRVDSPIAPGQFKKFISDQRALRYQEYESGELLFDEAQEQKTEAVTADGNRDVMTFDAD